MNESVAMEQSVVQDRINHNDPGKKQADMLRIANKKAEYELQEDLRQRWFILSKRSKYKEWWDYVVMTLAIYNCLWTPLTISFDWAEYTDRTSTIFRIADYTILTLYSIDIVVQFFTSYYNISSGDEINRPSKIASRYMKGDFFIDVLATFPFRLIEVGSEGYKAFAAMI